MPNETEGKGETARALALKAAGLEAATALGFDAPLARAAHQTFAAAVRAGYRESDDSALVDYYLHARTAPAASNEPEQR